MQQAPGTQPAVILTLAAYIRQHARLKPKSVRSTIAVDIQAAFTVIVTRNPTYDQQAYIDLHDTELAGFSVSNGYNFAYLAGADLSGSDLRNANLPGADFRNANLYKTDLRGAHLETGAIFFVPETVLATSRIITVPQKDSITRFDDARMEGADLSDSIIDHASFRDVDLDSANLRHADADGANFNGASLAGADLAGVSLGSSNANPFKGAIDANCQRTQVQSGLGEEAVCAG
jgi:uncharacterized protein YjbI with pentapeptide repeats